MNFRNLFLVLTLSMTMVSSKVMSGCISGDNYLLPAGHSYSLYYDILQAYNGGLEVCVTHNYGAPVLVEDGDGQELFTLEAGEICGLYQDVDVVKATCEGTGSNDCNISWDICGEDLELTIPEPPTTRPGTINKLASAEDSDGASLLRGFSRIDDFVNPCPEDTVLTPYEMPIYDNKGIFVVGYETVWYCIPENLEPAR